MILAACLQACDWLSILSADACGSNCSVTYAICCNHTGVTYSKVFRLEFTAMVAEALSWMSQQEKVRRGMRYRRVRLVYSAFWRVNRERLQCANGISKGRLIYKIKEGSRLCRVGIWYVSSRLVSASEHTPAHFVFEVSNVVVSQVDKVNLRDRSYVRA